MDENPNKESDDNQSLTPTEQPTAAADEPLESQSTETTSGSELDTDSSPAPATPMDPVDEQGGESLEVTPPSVQTIPTESSTPDPMSANQPAVNEPAQPKKRSTFKKLACFFIILLILGLATSTAVLAISLNDANKDVATLKADIIELDADTHDLPAGAIKVSECVPNMGFHYLPKDADPLFGPFLLVSKEGKVIGYEYMFSDDMFAEVPASIPLEVVKTDGPLLLNDWDYNSIDISRAPEGHPGFEENHVDVHLYTVPPDVQKKACE